MNDVDALVSQWSQTRADRETKNGTLHIALRHLTSTISALGDQTEQEHYANIAAEHLQAIADNYSATRRIATTFTNQP